MFVLPKSHKLMQVMARLGRKRMRTEQHMVVLSKYHRLLRATARLGMQRMRVAVRKIMHNRLHHLMDWVKMRYGREVSVLHERNMNSFEITRYRLAQGYELHLSLSFAPGTNEIECTLHPVLHESYLSYLVTNANGDDMITMQMPHVAMGGEVRVLADFGTYTDPYYFNAKRVWATLLRTGLRFKLSLKTEPMPQLKVFLCTVLGQNRLAILNGRLTPPNV